MKLHLSNHPLKSLVLVFLLGNLSAHAQQVFNPKLTWTSPRAIEEKTNKKDQDATVKKPKEQKSEKESTKESPIRIMSLSSGKILRIFMDHKGSKTKFNMQLLSKDSVMEKQKTIELDRVTKGFGDAVAYATMEHNDKFVVLMAEMTLRQNYQLYRYAFDGITFTLEQPKDPIFSSYRSIELEHDDTNEEYYTCAVVMDTKPKRYNYVVSRYNAGFEIIETKKFVTDIDYNWCSLNSLEFHSNGNLEISYNGPDVKPKSNLVAAFKPTTFLGFFKYKTGLGSIISTKLEGLVVVNSAYRRESDSTLLCYGFCAKPDPDGKENALNNRQQGLYYKIHSTNTGKILEKAFVYFPDSIQKYMRTEGWWKEKADSAFRSMQFDMFERTSSGYFVTMYQEKQHEFSYTDVDYKQNFEGYTITRTSKTSLVRYYSDFMTCQISPDPGKVFFRFFDTQGPRIGNDYFFIFKRDGEYNVLFNNLANPIPGKNQKNPIYTTQLHSFKDGRWIKSYNLSNSADIKHTPILSQTTFIENGNGLNLLATTPKTWILGR